MIHTEVRPVGQDLKKVVLLDGLSSKIKCHGQKFQIVLLNGLFPQKAHFTPKTKESYFSVFLQKFYIRFCRQNCPTGRSSYRTDSSLIY